jgi:hypothetical protein
MELTSKAIEIIIAGIMKNFSYFIVMAYFYRITKIIAENRSRTKKQKEESQKVCEKAIELEQNVNMYKK